MTSNDRIKVLRDTLELSQDQFGKSIGLTKSGISNIENGNRKVIERHIKLICAAHNVNEKWIRDGTGDMFYQPEVFSLDEYARKCNLMPLERDILRGYMELETSTRRDIMRHFRRIITEHTDEVAVENV